MQLRNAPQVDRGAPALRRPVQRLSAPLQCAAATGPRRAGPPSGGPSYRDRPSAPPFGGRSVGRPGRQPLAFDDSDDEAANYDRDSESAAVADRWADLNSRSREQRRMPSSAPRPRELEPQRPARRAGPPSSSARRASPPRGYDNDSESEGDLSAAGGGEGEDALSDRPDAVGELTEEELRDFRPKVTTRPAKDVTERDFFSRKSWAEVGCAPDVSAALSSLGFGRPSHIQALAFADMTGPPPAAGAATVVCDAAGSGKTLAYLAPALQLLRAAEAAGAGRARPRRPRAVVLAPTAELAAQVHGVCRGLSAAGARVRAVLVTGGRRLSSQSGVLEEGADVVVGTPGRVRQLLDSRALDLADCQILVLDECDVLLGGPFEMAPEVAPIKAALPPAARVVLVSATLPEQSVADARELFPRLRFLAGPNLHRPAAGVEERLVDCSGGEVSAEGAFRRKAEALLRLLAAAPAGSKTVVFCNKIDTCRRVENALKRSDRRARRFEVLPYHAAVDDDRREEALARFTKRTAAAGGGGGGGGLGGGGAAGTVLVATDRASRGLDSVAVNHVVLFDFPRDASEYVRRVGRTARGANGTGLVSVLVVVAIAQEIMARNAKGAPVARLPEDALVRSSPAAAQLAAEA